MSIIRLSRGKLGVSLLNKSMSNESSFLFWLISYGFDDGLGKWHV